MHDGYHGYYCYNVPMFVTRECMTRAARVFFVFLYESMLFPSARCTESLPGYLTMLSHVIE